MSALTQLTPAIPPIVDGLGDYAVRLAEALRQRGIESKFVTPAPGNVRAIDGFAIERLTAREAAILAEELVSVGARTLLVHFSGYGYARWGLCWWLVDGLRRWRQASGNRRLVTMFHELYATGPIGRTSFWTSWPQRRIARRLALLSDAVLATSDTTAAKLAGWRSEHSVVSISVFSNVGELSAPRPFLERAPTAIVFGQQARRGRVYECLASRPETIAGALRRLGVQRILDIGPAMSVPAELGGLPIEALGPLEGTEISAKLAEARVGIVDYPLHVFTKSGIIAAYMAHGMFVLNLSSTGVLPDRIEEGRHFVGLDRFETHAFDAESIAAAGHAWYRSHDLQATATVIHSLIS